MLQHLQIQTLRDSVTPLDDAHHATGCTVLTLLLADFRNLFLLCKNQELDPEFLVGVQTLSC